MQDDVALVGGGSMLDQIHPLPRTEKRPAVAHWNHDRGLGQCRADVSRHIVRAFSRVAVQGWIVRHDTREKPFEIVANIGVGVFLDQQRG